MLDTYRSVETPEGTELGIRVAGPLIRTLAWSLDCLIRIVLYVAVSVPLGLLGATGGGIFLLVLFAGEWFYPVLFEVLYRGATPGKIAFGLQVLHDDGTPVGWSASLIRNLLRFVDWLPAFYGLGLVASFLSRDFKRLGDLAAGTVVAYRARPLAERRLAPARPLAPPVALRLPEQEAVVAFAERQELWSEARVLELADVVSDLTGSHGRDGARRLLGMASWLQGKR